MKIPAFPEEYQQVMPYLVMRDAKGFIRFMQTVFGATEKMCFMRDEHTVAHAEVAIGRSVIMFSGAVDELQTCTGGCFVFVDDADAVYEKALAAGATSLQPVQNNPRGRSGGFKDPFGNSWWVKTHDPHL
ncbi:VOC family protein [Chitinophaga vietnamensis]|uniref:VOC family protein n=1 Tax=Chitinophaga vietnamensis TaxID=2593957 RepID=UPI0011786413|nr:VOC family protein [Chitinophaga vietnamensis]